ncbi:MAG: hypothetical protein AAGE59_13365 [Cyanobacteria bacterium P01_F01_bin.86]
MNYKTLMALWLPIGALSLFPATASAACVAGPDVQVNVGHGASIVFEEPVYQAQIFDPSRLILQPIPEQGTTTLMLSQVDPQHFSGMPQTLTTSLTAQTENGCYSFKLSYGTDARHVSVDANPQMVASGTLGADLLPGGEDIDLEALRSGYEQAVTEHGEDNTFLQRVARFLELAERGASQRLAARQSEVQWSHIQALEAKGLSDRLLSNNDTVGI